MPGGSDGKEFACNVRDQAQSLGWEDPLEKEMATHSSILAGESHGQRSLASYSPWGHKELDTTEQHIHTQGKEPEKTMYTHIAITKYCTYT